MKQRNQENNVFVVKLKAIFKIKKIDILAMRNKTFQL